MTQLPKGKLKGSVVGWIDEGLAKDKYMNNSVFPANIYVKIVILGGRPRDNTFSPYVLRDLQLLQTKYPTVYQDIKDTCPDLFNKHSVPYNDDFEVEVPISPTFGYIVCARVKPKGAGEEECTHQDEMGNDGHDDRQIIKSIHFDKSTLEVNNIVIPVKQKNFPIPKGTRRNDPSTEFDEVKEGEVDRTMFNDINQAINYRSRL